MSYCRDTFNHWITPVLQHEGWDKLVNDPDDPGGITKWGWSLRTLKTLGDLNHDDFPDGDIDHDGDVDQNDIINSAKGDAIELYFRHFWVKYGIYRFAPPVAGKLLDLGVNQGVKQATRELQRAVRSCSGQGITVDGLIGPQSLRMAGNCEATDLCSAFNSEAAGFYRVLIAQKPRMKKYRNGWLNRAYWRTF